MSSASGFRGRLILQAVVTALFAMTGSSATSGWTIPTLLVAAGAVFVGLAMRQEPSWRWYTVGFEGFAIAYGLVGLVSGHYVPGTLVAGWTLYYLLSHEGAGAFAGTPTWAPPAPSAGPWGPPATAAFVPVIAAAPMSAPMSAPMAAPMAAQVAVPMAGFAPVTAAAPAVLAAPAAPVQLPAPRPASMTILPRR